MKRLFLMLALLPLAAYAQLNCGIQDTLTDVAASRPIDNRTVQCTTFRITYYAQGFSALSIQIEGAPEVNGAPGTYTAFVGAVITSGTNPLTGTGGGTLLIQNANAAYVRMNLTSKTGTGSLSYVVYGSAGLVAQVSSGASGVTSFNARTGVVVPANGDYTAAQVTNAASLANQNNWLMDQSFGGHIASSASAATLSACGTSTIIGTDTRGTITFVGAPTACDLVFTTAFTTAPACLYTGGTGGSSTLINLTISTTGFHLTRAAGLLGMMTYLCFQ